MTLINCPECGNEISSLAAACPRCGAPPITESAETHAAGAHLTTIQETSKKLKLHILLGTALFFAGLTMPFYAGPDQVGIATATRHVTKW